MYPKLLKERESRSDEGRTIKEEKSRKNIRSLLSANFRRVEESLRVLEEYGKLISPAAAPLFKKLHFKMYVLEKDYLVKY
jgi:thiamine-phosphate pyrophosphorylase